MPYKSCLFSPMSQLLQQPMNTGRMRSAFHGNSLPWLTLEMPLHRCRVGRDASLFHHIPIFVQHAIMTDRDTSVAEPSAT